jgi:hypothetical protein
MAIAGSASITSVVGGTGEMRVGAVDFRAGGADFRTGCGDFRAGAGDAGAGFGDSRADAAAGIIRESPASTRRTEFMDSERPKAGRSRMGTAGHEDEERDQ